MRKYCKRERTTVKIALYNLYPVVPGKWRARIEEKDATWATLTKGEGEIHEAITLCGDEDNRISRDDVSVDNFMVTLDAKSLAPNIYKCEIVIESDGSEANNSVAVELTVEPGPVEVGNSQIYIGMSHKRSRAYAFSPNEILELPVEPPPQINIRLRDSKKYDIDAESIKNDVTVAWHGPRSGNDFLAVEDGLLSFDFRYTAEDITFGMYDFTINVHSPHTAASQVAFKVNLTKRDDCPPNEIADTTGKKCICLLAYERRNGKCEPCDDLSEVWSPNEQRCVCAPGLEKGENGKCSPCDDVSEIWSKEKEQCVCAAGHKDVKDVKGVCEPCNQATERWDHAKNRCVCSKLYKEEGSKCVPCGTKEYWSETNERCETCQYPKIILGDACVCRQEYYTVSRNETEICQECPRGGVCTGRKVVYPAQGYYKIDEYVFAKCNHVEACPGVAKETVIKELQINPVDEILENILFEDCSEGYRGLICGSCDSEFGRTMMSSECKPCASRSTHYILFAIAIVAAGSFIGFLTHRTLKQDYEKLKRGRLVLCAKIVVTHAQIVGLVALFPFQWPSFVRGMFSAFDFASSMGKSALSIQCARGGDGGLASFYMESLIIALLPISVIFICTCVSFMISYMQRGTQKQFRGRDASFISSMIALFCFIHIFRERRFRFSLAKKSAMHTTLFWILM